MLGYLRYRYALVPRAMAVPGLIGVTLLMASGVAVLFGVIEAGCVCEPSGPSRKFLGALAWHLAHHQGLQSIRNHFREIQANACTFLAQIFNAY